MTGPLILTLTTFLPLAGALLILALRIVGGSAVAGSASKGIALLTSLATLVVSLMALSQFDPSKAGYQLIDHAPWFGGSSYKMGVDGLAIALVVLTTALTPLCILQSMKSIEERLATCEASMAKPETDEPAEPAHEAPPGMVGMIQK